MKRALSERESQIAALVAQGKANKEIARMLDLNDSTVKVHLHNIYSKLGLHNRTQLAMLTMTTQPCADCPLRNKE